MPTDRDRSTRAEGQPLGGPTPPGNQIAQPTAKPTGRVVRAAHPSCPP